MATSDLRVWVIDHRVCGGTLERLGDGRAVADTLKTGLGLLLVGEGFSTLEKLHAHGADHVLIAEAKGAAQRTRLLRSCELLAPHQPRLVLAAGDGVGREWAALLAARMGWRLISPVLMVACRQETLRVSALDDTHRFARTVDLREGEVGVVTLREGVAEALPALPERGGTIERYEAETAAEPITIEKHLPADPRTVDIQFARRLVAGGRGLGSREGFDVLRRLAERIGAGIAASRMAVDLGWIEYERQVGQTGKTVKPDLYLACGISGASHHLEGMSDARHIIAINNDREAPIFKVAHLGLVADLHEVLDHAMKELS